MNRSSFLRILVLLMAPLFFVGCSTTGSINEPPEGFTPLFNGQNLEGWWGTGNTNPRKYVNLPSETLEKRKKASMPAVRNHWWVKDGILINDGKGPFLTTDKFYEDFELRIDYKTPPGADSGIYLRGIPQVQIWDYRKDHGKKGKTSDNGSGGLYNNPEGWPGRHPSTLADRPFGEWNKLRIFMVGERVTVFLNGKRVVDHARLNNFFDRKTPADRRKPVPRVGPIQLQTHGAETRWRNIFIRDIDQDEANKILRRGGVEKAPRDSFTSLFNGKNLDNWTGKKNGYKAENGVLKCQKGTKGTLYTKEVFDNFEVQLEIRIPPAANNGLAIRYPGEGSPAYDGFCEIQVLDNTADKWSSLKPPQYHGSAYAQWPAHRGYLRKPGSWNFHRVRVKGSHVTVELNGTTILYKDLAEVAEDDLMYEKERFKGRELTVGHFGFAGHGDPVSFRNIRIKPLKKSTK